MKKVLFVARDPGGANSLLPIIQKYSKNNLCDVFAKDFAVKIFENNFIDFTKIDNIKEIPCIVDTYCLIVTGTSFNDDLEHDLWEYTQNNHIVSIGYLDHWMGYDRFFNKKKNKFIFPKKLIVVDAIAKKAFNSKYPDSKVDIISLGSPFLEKVLVLKKEENKYDDIIVYAAEKIKGFEIEKQYSFNEYDQFSKLFNILKSLDKDCSLYFLPHPKHSYDEVYKELNYLLKQDSKVKIIINKKEKKDELVEKSSKVFGINTMVLVEAMLMKKAVCSMQIGIAKESDFQLVQHNYIYNANTEKKLLEFLENKTKSKMYDTNYIKNSTNKIVEYIKNNV